MAKKENGSRAASALLFQAALCALSGALAALAALAFSGRALWALHSGGQWIGWPALGAWTAFRSVRRGVPAICAWPIPAVSAVGVYWLITGIPPSAGAAVLTAALSLVFAAVGETLENRHK